MLACLTRVDTFKACYKHCWQYVFTYMYMCISKQTAVKWMTYPSIADASATKRRFSCRNVINAWVYNVKEFIVLEGCTNIYYYVIKNICTYNTQRQKIHCCSVLVWLISVISLISCRIADVYYVNDNVFRWQCKWRNGTKCNTLVWCLTCAYFTKEG